MKSKNTLTTLVTGIPPSVHSPERRPGESTFKYLVSQHQHQWENFTQDLDRRFKVPSHTRQMLQSLNVGAITDDRIVNEIENWINERMPTHHRTLACLVRLRERLRDDLYGVELLQILWPRESSSSDDPDTERAATGMGVEVLSFSAGLNRMMDFPSLLQYVKGDYLWVVPGGCRITPSMFTASVPRIFDEFVGNPRTAMYYDGMHSAVYRCSALRNLAIKRGFIPANMQDIARELRDSGYLFCADKGRESALCEFERIYGG
jgi:hypothetical protein